MAKGESWGETMERMEKQHRADTFERIRQKLVEIGGWKEYSEWDNTIGEPHVDALTDYGSIYCHLQRDRGQMVIHWRNSIPLSTYKSDSIWNTYELSQYLIGDIYRKGTELCVEYFYDFTHHARIEKDKKPTILKFPIW